MITARSPLRISLGGGGTDLASYYEENEGFVISAAIDKYVYVNVMRPFKEGIYLKTPQIEIVTLADIPSGTGLGSSGSFTTALIKALYTHRKRHVHQEDLAQIACQIEIDLLKEPIGKQDQYAASTGGLTCFTFHKNGNVSAKPLGLSMETIFKLEDNLLLFFTGYSRKASSILKDQKIKSEIKDIDMINNLHYVKKLGFEVKDTLESGDLNAFGELMNEHWNYKKNRSIGMTNSDIDQWYDLALKNGAIGGKLVGAGGGGFLMFMAKDRDLLRKKMSDLGLEEVRFKFDFEGTKVV